MYAALVFMDVGISSGHSWPAWSYTLKENWLLSSRSHQFSIAPQLKVGTYKPLLPYAGMWTCLIPASLPMAAVSSWMQRSCHPGGTAAVQSPLSSLSQSLPTITPFTMGALGAGEWSDVLFVNAHSLHLLWVSVLAMYHSDEGRELHCLWVGRDGVRGRSDRKSIPFNSNFPLPFLQHLVISLFCFIFLWICLFTIFIYVEPYSIYISCFLHEAGIGELYSSL